MFRALEARSIADFSNPFMRQSIIREATQTVATFSHQAVSDQQSDCGESVIDLSQDPNFALNYIQDDETTMESRQDQESLSGTDTSESNVKTDIRTHAEISNAVEVTNTAVMARAISR